MEKNNQICVEITKKQYEVNFTMIPEMSNFNMSEFKNDGKTITFHITAGRLYQFNVGDEIFMANLILRFIVYRLISFLFQSKTVYFR